MGHIIGGVRYERFPPFDELPGPVRDHIVQGIVQLYGLEGRGYGVGRRENAGRDQHFTSAEAGAKVGRRVRTLMAFSGVPKGTTGIILEPDDELVTLPIQWNLPGRRWQLVDWFSKWEYEKYLEEISIDGSTELAEV